MMSLEYILIPCDLDWEQIGHRYSKGKPLRRCREKDGHLQVKEQGSEETRTDNVFFLDFQPPEL
jgi:hypothetical protein